ncbi:MAG: PDZ domain-containing protein, partial [Salinispira sp.]
MNKQNHKCIALMCVILMIPALAFASGDAESDSYDREMKRGRKMRGDRDHEHGLFMDAVPGMGGVMVIGVEEGSPADNAGLQAHDFILAVGDQQIIQLQKAIQEFTPGDAVELTIARPRAEDADQILPEELKITITLGSDDEGNAYAGIQYLPGKGFGRRGKGGFSQMYWNLGPEEREELENLKEQMLEFMEQYKL